MWAAGMRRNAMRVLSIFGTTSLFQNFVVGTLVDPTVLDSCPGYSATDVKDDGTRLTADLVLNGKGCNIFGSDLQKLTLDVVYETGEFLPVEFVDNPWS
jgi:alpha-glucosidase